MTDLLIIVGLFSTALGFFRIESKLAKLEKNDQLFKMPTISGQDLIVSYNREQKAKQAN